MKIKVGELTLDSFAPYGSYIFPNECDKKDSVINFYPDMLTGISEFSFTPSISVLGFSKRDFVIDVTESHDHTEEIFGGYNVDVLFHVAAYNNATPNPDDFKVFRLPKGGFVRVKRKIWHHAPFTATGERATGIVILPPFTYTHDCFVVELKEKISFEL